MLGRLFSRGADDSASAPSRRRFRGTARTAVRNFMAGQGDRLAGAAATPLAADAVVLKNLRPLVGRSREQASSNDYMKAFLDSVRLNVIGAKGIAFQCMARNGDRTLDKGANDAVELAWSKWSKRANCSVDGRSSLRSIQRELIMAAAQDGEFLVRLVYGEDAGPWGFALQVLDPQRLPVDFQEDNLGGGRFIRHGIEFNRVGRPLAYYIQTEDPGRVGYTWGGRDYERVPADVVVHGFDPILTGQKRGLPWAATSLWRLQMLGGFEQAALVNARTSAAKGGWLQWREGWEPDPSDEGADEEDRDVEFEVQPGMYQELAPGLEAKSNDPQYPSGELAVFNKAMLRGAAAGMGVAYNGLARDLEGVNLSSIRHGVLEERQGWMDRQEWFVEAAMEPIYLAWLRYSLLAGKIVSDANRPLPPSRLEKLSHAHWQPRRWDWIDPLKEVQANIHARDALLVSPGQLIRERGSDPATVWAELARDIEEMRAAGIPEEFIVQAINSKTGGSLNGSPQQGGQGAPSNDDD